MQGEGQEFESPRLHHLSGGSRPQQKSSGHTRGDIRPTGPVRTGHHRAPDPCPAMPAGHRPADRWGRPIPYRSSEVHFGGPHLYNWIVFGRNEESSISPSSQGNDPDRSRPSTDRLVRGWRGSSYKGHGVDALAPRADEGRGRLRKAPGSREQTSIRRCPNGETRLEKSSSPLVESNRPGGGKPAN